MSILCLIMTCQLSADTTFSSSPWTDSLLSPKFVCEAHYVRASLLQKKRNHTQKSALDTYIGCTGSIYPRYEISISACKGVYQGYRCKNNFQTQVAITRQILSDLENSHFPLAVAIQANVIFSTKNRVQSLLFSEYGTRQSSATLILGKHIFLKSPHHFGQIVASISAGFADKNVRWNCAKAQTLFSYSHDQKVILGYTASFSQKSHRLRKGVNPRWNQWNIGYSYTFATKSEISIGYEYRKYAHVHRHKRRSFLQKSGQYVFCFSQPISI